MPCRAPQVNLAIELYHQALSLKPDDTFTSEMLSQALRDALEDTADPTHLPDAFSATKGAPRAPSAGRPGSSSSVVSMDVGAP